VGPRDRFGRVAGPSGKAREQRKLKRRLRSAKLRYVASFEDVNFKHPRSLDLVRATWAEENS
jgi:DNA replication protein DnaC